VFTARYGLCLYVCPSNRSLTQALQSLLLSCFLSNSHSDMRLAYFDATYITLQSLFTPHFSIVLVLFHFHKNYLVSAVCVAVELHKNSSVQFLLIYLLSEQHNSQSQNSTSSKKQHKTQRNIRKRTKHNKSTSNHNHVECHYNKFTTRCCYKTPPTASHVTYSKQNSIQQSAIHISDGPKLPTVTDVQYMVRNRDGQHSYKCTTVIVNCTYHLL
jgi:hypothetical protein